MKRSPIVTTSNGETNLGHRLVTVIYEDGSPPADPILGDFLVLAEEGEALRIFEFEMVGRHRKWTQISTGHRLWDYVIKSCVDCNLIPRHHLPNPF